MTDHRAPGPQVITLPAEIDLSNSEQVGNDLRAAFQPGASVVVADLTVTTFCDTSGARTLLVASKEASAAHIELRLAVQDGNVRRTMRLLGLDHVLHIYPTVAEALIT